MCAVTVQLVGGRHLAEGRLEVKRANKWGSVCSDRFDDVAAGIAVSVDV